MVETKAETPGSFSGPLDTKESNVPKEYATRKARRIFKIKIHSRIGYWKRFKEGKQMSIKMGKGV